MKNLSRIALAIYGLVAIFSFGHSVVHHARPTDPVDIQISFGLISGVAWPLYWSWELNQRYRVCL